MNDDGQVRLTPEMAAAVERWLKSNGLSLADLQGQTTQRAPQQDAAAAMMQSVRTPKRSDSITPNRAKGPYAARSSSPYNPGGVAPVYDAPDAEQNFSSYLTGQQAPANTDAFDILNAPGISNGSRHDSPFANFFNGGDLGGGTPSPDLNPEYKFGKTENPHGGFIGPVAPTPDEVNAGRGGRRGNGNLKAINALMELAANAPQPGESAIDIAGIMKEAAGAAAAPFKAQIGTTRRQNQRAKADTEYGSKEIRKMYRSLARSNRNAAKRESNQSLDTSAEFQAQSQASADELEADNSARLDAAAANAAALGSGDLAATLSADINANTSEGARQIAETANNAATAVVQRGEAERRYLNRSANNAKLVGTNRAADLYGDLQDYLQGNRDKIAELRGQQAAAVGQAQQAASASAAQAQSNMYEQAYGAHQDLLNNQMALLGMKTDLQGRAWDQKMDRKNLSLAIQKMQMDAAGEQSPIPGMSEQLLEALPQNERSALMLQQFLNPASGDALSQIMKNPAIRQGYYEDAEGQKIPLGGNPLNSEQLMAALGMSSDDPQQNYILSQIIAQLASANTDLPYGAQR